MTISQSKIGEIEKKFTRRSRTARSIQKCNKKGTRVSSAKGVHLAEILLPVTTQKGAQDVCEVP
jgi:hypothetical protein